MSTVLGPLIHLLQTVLDGLRAIGLPWGVAIVGVTVIVRLLLLPLAVKQQRAAQQMQALQPRIKELQARHTNDRGALQRETMALYREAKVNPLASLLPLLIQMPVFLALYYSIRQTHALDTAAFLWLPALGAPDPTYALLAIYVATQLVSTRLSFTLETPSQQRWMMGLLPLVMVLFLMHFPAGLFVYWITSNLWTIAQQLALRRWAPPVRPALAVGTEHDVRAPRPAAEAKRRRSGSRRAATRALGSKAHAKRSSRDAARVSRAAADAAHRPR